MELKDSNIKDFCNYWVNISISWPLFMSKNKAEARAEELAAECEDLHPGFGFGRSLYSRIRREYNRNSKIKMKKWKN